MKKQLLALAVSFAMIGMSSAAFADVDVTADDDLKDNKVGVVNNERSADSFNDTKTVTDSMNPNYDKRLTNSLNTETDNSKTNDK
jgi:hypothetical protein